MYYLMIFYNEKIFEKEKKIKIRWLYKQQQQ